MTLENQRVTIKIASIASIVVFIVGATAYEVNYQAGISNRIESLTSQMDMVKTSHIAIEKKQDGLDVKQNSNDIQFARIQAQLEGINANVLEIKSRMFK